MRLRSIIHSFLLIALSLAGVAHAASPSIGNPAPAAPSLLSWLVLQPPPPPPQSCPTICRMRLQSCLNAGGNPSVCAGKYNFCLINCSNPPIFTL